MHDNRKSAMTEDVSPMKHGDFPLPCYSLGEFTNFPPPRYNTFSGNETCCRRKSKAKLNKKPRRSYLQRGRSSRYVFLKACVESVACGKHQQNIQKTKRSKKSTGHTFQVPPLSNETNVRLTHPGSRGMKGIEFFTAESHGTIYH